MPFEIVETTLGLAGVAVGPSGVRALVLGDDADAVARELARTAGEGPRGGVDPTLLDAVRRRLDDPVARDDLPLSPEGTPFQQEVWAALRKLPAGSTTTYAALADAIGRPASSARAVAAACAANPIAVLIPCHRVGTDGSLTGYRWGLARKRMLLDREEALAQAALPFATPG